MDFFKEQLDLALSKYCLELCPKKKEYERTISVHCVRAFGEVLKIFKKAFKAAPENVKNIKKEIFINQRKK